MTDSSRFAYFNPTVNSNFSEKSGFLYRKNAVYLIRVVQYLINTKMRYFACVRRMLLLRSA